MLILDVIWQLSGGCSHHTPSVGIVTDCSFETEDKQADYSFRSGRWVSEALVLSNIYFYSGGLQGGRVEAHVAGGRCRYLDLCPHFELCAAFAAKSDGRDSGQNIRLYRCGPSHVHIISCQASPMQKTDAIKLVRRRNIATLHRPFDRFAFSGMLLKRASTCQQSRTARDETSEKRSPAQ
jgi:hypothetical protein